MFIQFFFLICGTCKWNFTRDVIPRPTKVSRRLNGSDVGTVAWLNLNARDDACFKLKCSTRLSVLPALSYLLVRFTACISSASPTLDWRDVYRWFNEFNFTRSIVSFLSSLRSRKSPHDVLHTKSFAYIFFLGNFVIIFLSRNSSFTWHLSGTLWTFLNNLTPFDFKYFF